MRQASPATQNRSQSEVQTKPQSKSPERSQTQVQQKGEEQKKPQFKKSTLKELTAYRVKRQEQIAEVYPEIPLIAKLIQTFEELSYQMSDQEDFLNDRLIQLKEQFAGHYMTKQNKLLMQENKDLKSQLETNKANLTNEGRLKEIEKELENTKKRAGEEERKYNDAQKQIKNKKEEEEKMRGELQQAKKLNDAKNDQLKNEQQKKDQLSQSVAEKDRKLQQAEKEKRELEEKLKNDLAQAIKQNMLNQQKNNSQQDKHQNDLNNLKKQQTTEKQELEKENKKFQARISQLEATNNEFQRKIQSLEQELKKQDQERNKVTDAQLKLQSKDEEISTLHQKLSMTSQQLHVVNTKNKALEKMVKDKDEELKEKKQPGYKSELEKQLESQIVVLENSVLKLELENGELLQKNKELDFNLKQMEEQMQNERQRSPKVTFKKTRKSSPSPILNNKLIRSQERVKKSQRQLEHDIQFSSSLLESVRRSREGSLGKLRQNPSENELSHSMKHNENVYFNDEYCTFAPDKREYQHLHYKLRSLLHELRKIKEAIYIKMEQTQTLDMVDEEEEERQIFKQKEFTILDSDLVLILEQEVAHLKFMESVMNQTHQEVQAKNKKAKSFVIQNLVELIPYEQRKANNSSSITQHVQEVKQYIKQLDRQINILNMGDSKDLDKYQQLQKDNDYLRDQVAEYEQELAGRISEEEQNQYDDLIQDLSKENTALVEKAEGLSENLKILASELEFLREQQEKSNKENFFLKRQVKQAEQEKEKMLSSERHGSSPPMHDRQLRGRSNQHRDYYVNGGLDNKEDSRNVVNERDQQYLNEMRMRDSMENQDRSPNENVYKRNGVQGYQQRMRDSSVPARNGEGSFGMLSPEKSIEIQRKAEMNRRKREEENQKLTQLINDYRNENDKCTKRIQELKDKLLNQKQRQGGKVKGSRFHVDRGKISQPNRY